MYDDDASANSGVARRAVAAVDGGRLSVGGWRAGCCHAYTAGYAASSVGCDTTLFEEKLQSRPRKTELTKVIDGYLPVRYLPPCEIVPSPALWVASIILTDLRSGSVVYLNSDGTVKGSSEADYNTEEGTTELEAALKDNSVMEQVVARPECP